ncbi:GNAT family N-acetyltransferase [Streptococcus pluranimalium]|uniref:Ribosomal N-acetyltransferase YdaF n=1 Tax=Streptococcus pluranimalium TaxID=82348 RepID=A0A345VJT5_9STRE|nr:GNAT family protein [Streptococcus pluranimalium]AXJ12987.1 Putative ribosomal N-acetyltransferase YdaF [Streptococcus pluranimalium]
MKTNHFGQLVGDSLAIVSQGRFPDIEVLSGQTVRIEKVNVSHFDDLYAVYSSLTSPEKFTYMPFSQFEDKEEFGAFFQELLESKDPYYLAIIDQSTEKVVGCFSLMRIDTRNRVIEMGWVIYSDSLQKTKLATEAQYLVTTYVFEDLCYRRYEWKCDSLNEASRRAAERLGFTYEGTFRQAVIYKNRNRDTNWYSIIDKEWSEKKSRLEAWLDDSNFDTNGKQITPLREC